MIKEIGVDLGKRIGKVKEIDLGDAGDCLGKYIWVRVEVDVSKPLERGFFIDLGDLNMLWSVLCTKDCLTIAIIVVALVILRKSALMNP